jgi:hypothetical protein
LLLSAEQDRNTSSLLDAKAAKSHHSLNHLLNSPSSMIRFRNPFFIITTILCSTWSSIHGQDRLFHRKRSSRQSQHGVHPDCHFLRSRRLEEISAFEVQLFLELQFVSESTAALLETREISRTVVAHFCSAVQTQVRVETSRNVKKFDTRRKKRSLKLHHISLFFADYFCRQLAIS